MHAPCGSDGLKKTTRVNLSRTCEKKKRRGKFQKRRVSKTGRSLIKSRRLEIFAENRSFPAKTGGLESLNQTKHYDKYWYSIPCCYYSRIYKSFDCVSVVMSVCTMLVVACLILQSMPQFHFKMCFLVARGLSFWGLPLKVGLSLWGLSLKITHFWRTALHNDD